MLVRHIGLVFILHYGFANAFWRLLCQGNVGLARMDPLVNPGVVSDHVHTIKGGSGESRKEFFVVGYVFFYNH